jgi:hypothetical protein
VFIGEINRILTGSFPEINAARAPILEGTILAAHASFDFEAGAKRHSLTPMHAAEVIPRSGIGILKPLPRRWCRMLRLAGLILLLLHFAAQAGLALELTTTDGHTYKDCTITKVEPDALRIIHSDDAARIPYDKLPPAIQKQYFDPAKVAAYREQIAEAKRAAAAKAEEERRQLQIAAAQAEEQREQEAAARQREEDEKKAAAQSAEEQRVATEHTKAMAGVGLMVVVFILCTFLYFLPTIVGRHKTNIVAIFVFNLFLGWTFLGWVLALVWACTEDSAMDRLARERMRMPPDPPRRPYPEHEPLPDREPYADRGTLRDREGRFLE